MSAAETRRIGFIVPSSNTTIETEIPLMLARADLGVPVTFHSSRAVLHSVDKESLDRMVADSDRCAGELADARVDVIAYACLVALMARGAGAHEEIERHLAEVVAAAGGSSPIVSSAGALIRTLQREGVERVAIMTPYMPPLTKLVADYIQAYDIEVVDSLSLAVSNNVEVGKLPQAGLRDHARGLDLGRAQALIASACVQMPSLEVLEDLETDHSLPVISAATATAAEILDALGLDRSVPGAGSLLAGTAGS
ncbi:MAG: aspartate/glutamate racemase family protein [Actinobacteria bacterium]|nr:aspartate/glutamate racemase family protein [Actinomycetota bacterium]